jgi:transposase InsO family protein
MTWKEMSPKMLKMEFLADWRKNDDSMVSLCRKHGISPKTVSKLIARWRDEQEGALIEHSRAPKSHPNATPEPVRQAIIGLRMKHKGWGPKKLRKFLQKYAGHIQWPALSTFGEILAREGLTASRGRPKSRACPHEALPPEAPNDVWGADYKGHFLTTNRTRCDPLTITDSYSRMILCCVALSPPISTREVQEIFTHLFRKHGLPLAIKSDNGAPFAATGLGLTRLSAWWIQLGISPRRIPPGKPQKNGRHERMHRVLKEETTRPRPAASLTGQQKRFDAFVREYNILRPHEALDFAMPASLYTDSPRPFPEKIAAPEYPEGALVRRVTSKGCIRWHKEQFYLSSALCGQDVWIVPHDEEPVLSVIYYRELLGRVDLMHRCVLGPDPGALPQTPEFTALWPLREAKESEAT